jgi:hypothetical protein
MLFSKLDTKEYRDRSKEGKNISITGEIAHLCLNPSCGNTMSKKPKAPKLSELHERFGIPEIKASDDLDSACSYLLIIPFACRV